MDLETSRPIWNIFCRQNWWKCWSGHWRVRERKIRGEFLVPGMSNWVDARAVREMGKALKEIWVLRWDHKGGSNDKVIRYLVSVGQQCTTTASLCRMFPNIHLPAYSFSLLLCLLLHHFLFLILSLFLFFFVVILFPGQNQRVNQWDRWSVGS